MVMAALAKGLPVRFVPEQFRITAMRFDMIHDGRRDETAFCFATDAPGMTFQEELPGLLPFPAVTTCLCTGSVALALPFVTEIWQIYVLIAVLQSASACFTPLFQSVIPQILPDEAKYTRALSLSRLAYDLESLLSPALAAALLTVIAFQGLFVGTSAGFLLSALGTLAASSHPERFEAAVRAADALGGRTVSLCSLNSTVDELSRRFDPSQHGVWRFAPLAQVLPRVRGVLHSGSHGTNSMTLAADTGVPPIENKVSRKGSSRWVSRSTISFIADSSFKAFGR